VAVVGWVFHVGAIALAPLSLAQAVIAGGFVVLAVLAERLFGFELQRRQWGGIALVAVGLAILGVTTPTTAEQTRYSIVAIAAFQTILLVVGLVLVLVTHVTAVHHAGPIDETSSTDHRTGDRYPSTGGAPQAPVTAHTTPAGGSKWAGILLGTAAGIAFGVSDVSIKALAEDVIDDPLAIGQSLGGHRADRLDRRVLRVGPEPPDRRRDRRHHRHDVGGEPVHDRGRHHRLRRARRRRRAGGRPAAERFPARRRGRDADARPYACRRGGRRGGASGARRRPSASRGA
jgi:hypothetical protein